MDSYKVLHFVILLLLFLFLLDFFYLQYRGRSRPKLMLMLFDVRLSKFNITEILLAKLFRLKIEYLITLAKHTQNPGIPSKFLINDSNKFDFRKIMKIKSTAQIVVPFLGSVLPIKNFFDLPSNFMCAQPSQIILGTLSL